ncbi:hypothetical protein E3O42_13380 [Cryobacterium adonitolivorans]|uniref:Uncharacterized protein n=1 Tax=Cryobacterium adonitolivorans TaxID=1259189 RepID=A0A4R8W308_9MICO|nr:hypothetical protein [Cryobacterium adonitolivorans]TFB99542.1 hypothetical protein E3O42_13380 [Cryobacterium adonitolivorans]
MNRTSTTPAPPHRPAAWHRWQWTSIAVTVGFLIVVGFQLSLLLGAPWGAAALGGANAGTLPAELRVVSAVSAVIWGVAAVIVLARGGFSILRVPPALSRWGTWVLVGYLALGVLLNLASSSPWERFGWAPFTAVLFGLTLLLALSGREGQPAGPTGARPRAKRW